MHEIIIALENIRSIHNIGAIIRTAEFFGITEVMLTGYSGYDPDESDLLNSKLKKTALSSLTKVKITHYSSTHEMIQNFSDFKLICLENNDPRSTPLSEFIPSERFILLFGNEINGVEESTRVIASQIIEITRIGVHPSLNVSTAAGIAIYHCTKSNNHREKPNS